MSKDVVQRPHAKINAADYGSRPSPGRLGWVGASPRPHVHATKTPARRARSGVFSLVHPHSEKYSAFSEIEIGCISITVSSHLKGRIAIVTSAGRDAVDASGASDESACSLRTAKPCGPDASRLASSRWTFRRRRRQQRPISGESAVAVTHCVRGCRVISGATAVNTRVHSSPPLRTRGCGAFGHPAFPRALHRRIICNNSDATRRERRTHVRVD